jgi:hypothetical protein
MLSKRYGARKFTFLSHFGLLLFMIFFFLCDPSFVSCSERYYYLHISSFREKKRAVQDVERLQNKGYHAMIEREHIADKGYWYRVYIGPFASLQEAKLAMEGLRKKRLVKYIALKRKESLILGDSKKGSEKEEEKERIEAKKETPKPKLPQELSPPVHKKTVKVFHAHEKPLRANEKVPPQIAEEERQTVKEPLPVVIVKPAEKISTKPPLKTPKFEKKGKGRHLARGEFALGLRHTFRQVKPELTKRKRITSDGTTTTVEEIAITKWEKDEFPTKVHMDSLRIRLGITDYLEGFAEIGGAYQELSNLGFDYGGGLHLRLFQINEGRFRGLYGGLQGGYLVGEAEYDYNSSVGNRWKKETDWKEFVAKGELGAERSGFAIYLGAAYFRYSEDTNRQLLDNIPSSLTLFEYRDCLKKESLGAYGGVVICLTPAVSVNVEGQVFSQKSIFGTVEYHF